MAYSLGAQCASELIGMMLTIYLGEGIIANELLSKTKGARMGWLAVAFGFGLSFGVVIFMFGFISAHLNPAMCLALWTLGKISFTTFLALSASEFAGAFLGACLVFLHYLPHFKTVPEPPATSMEDLLLRSRDVLSPEALAIASYDTRQEERREQGPLGLKAGLEQAVKDVKFYFASNGNPSPKDHKELVEVALGMSPAAEARGELLRRRSVQVCDVHRRLESMTIEDFNERMHLPHVNPAGTGGMKGSASVNLAQLQHNHSAPDAAGGPAGSAVPPEAPISSAGSAPIGQTGGAGKQGQQGQQEAPRGRLSSAHEETGASGGGTPANGSDFDLVGKAKAAVTGAALRGRTFLSSVEGLDHLADAYKKHVDKVGHEQRQRADVSGRLLDAAIVADQNAKLSIFATRPAIYSPVFNFICELMCTAALIFGALMMDARAEMLPPPERAAFLSTLGFYIGIYVFVVVLSLGGPTGIAANPARDMGPRIAHWVLPISGKGPSEFFYSWVPFTATLAGGAVAGGLYMLVQKLNHSQWEGA